MGQPVFNAKIIDAKLLLNEQGLVPEEACLKADYLTFYAVFGAGTTVGTILIEGAHDPTFTGVWALLGTLAWTVASSVKSVTVVGSHRAVRARISIAVAGGTVDVYATVSRS